MLIMPVTCLDAPPKAVRTIPTRYATDPKPTIFSIEILFDKISIRIKAKIKPLRYHSAHE